MATRIADAALRIRAAGTEDARRAILRLNGAVQNVGGSVERTTRAMKPLRDRVDLLVQATKSDATRAQALTKLAGVENTLTRMLERGNLSLVQRVKLEEQLARVQSALKPPPVSFGRADTGAVARRVSQLADGVKLEATRAESLRRLAGVEAGLSAALQRGNLTLQQRIALEGQLARVQTIRAATTPKVDPAAFGRADTAAVSRRIALLAEGLKLEGTRAVSLSKLAGVEAGLTRALQRTNLTLEQRIRLEAQLARVRALRVPPPVETPGFLAGTRGALGFLGVTVGAGAAIRALGSMNDAVDESETAQRKLQASSKLTGVALGTIAGIATDARRSLGLSSTAATDFTQSVIKLTSRANEVNKSGEFMNRWLDLAAANGLSADEALQALNTTLIGQDEGLNRLGLANPQQIYEKWANAAGKSAAKMTEAEKAQAIVNEILVTGGKVAGEYSKRLETAAGKQDQFSNALKETAASFGRSIQPAREWGLETGTSLLHVLRILNDVDDKVSGLPTKWRILRAALTRGVGGLAAELAIIDAERNAPRTPPPGFVRQGPPQPRAPIKVESGVSKEQLEALEKELSTLTKLRDLKRLTAADSKRLLEIERQLAAELKTGGLATERRAQLEGMLADARGKSKKETKSAVEALEEEAGKLVELQQLRAITGEQINRAIAIEAELTAKVKSGTLAVDDRIRAEKALQELRAAGFKPLDLKDVQRPLPTVDIAPPPTLQPRTPARADEENVQRVLDAMDRLRARGGATAEAAADEINERFRKRLAEGKPITLNFVLDQERLEQLAQDVDAQFETFLPRVGSVVAAAIGAGFSGGLGDAKKVVLQGLGSIFMEMGNALLVSGAAMIGLLPALSNPFTSGPAMLVAGGILTALGGLLGGLATGKSKGGGGRVSGAERAGAPDPTIRVTFDPDRRLREAVEPQSRVQPLPDKPPATPPPPQVNHITFLGDPTPSTERWVRRNLNTGNDRGLDEGTR